MSMQERLTNEIKRRLSTADVDFEIDTSWANCLIWRLLNADGYSSFASFRTEFYDGYWQCQGFNNQPRQGKDAGCYIQYTDSKKWLNTYFDNYLESTVTGSEQHEETQ